jgi:phosphatidylinositol alpha-1,6-mannosyltransferase
VLKPVDNRGKNHLSRATSTFPNFIFVFLEIFAQEGGIQSYIKDILQAYLALNQISTPCYLAEVFLLRDEPGCLNPFDNGSIKFHYLKTLPAWKGRLRLAFWLLACLIQRRPQQVFCGHIKLAPLIRALCHPLKVPYTLLTYGKEVWEPLPTSQRKALEQAAVIWTISRYSRDRLCQANGIDPCQVRILPCVVDRTVFTPGAKSPELVKRYELGDAKVLLTVARLWSGDIYKGVDVTLRALPRILQAFPDTKYLIVGRGDDQPRLAQLAQDLGVAQQVIFAGFVPTSDLVKHYRLADAYLMPSQEGFGIVYLEAMACGIPVLSGETDGSADPLQDGRLGWRVPYQNHEAVAMACIEMLQGKDQRCQGQWLREQTLAQFSKEILREKLTQLLNLR